MLHRNRLKYVPGRDLQRVGFLDSYECTLHGTTDSLLVISTAAREKSSSYEYLTKALKGRAWAVRKTHGRDFRCVEFFE